MKARRLKLLWSPFGALVAFGGGVLLWTGGCDRNEAKEVAVEVASPVAAAAVIEEWTSVGDPGLTNRQKAQLELAEKARGAMGQRLMGKVMEAAQASGFGGAVEVCKEEAGPIARGVAEEMGVEIGRTSLKLRNPENKAPKWATAYVASGDEERVVVQGPADELGVLLPIHLAAPCLSCHGETSQLAEGVVESLARLYPDDEATGFDKGDLRGWFWIEVPRAAVDVPDELADVVQQAATGAADASSPEETAYKTYCAACHGQEGQGTPGVFPPLAGTERVQGDPAALIALTLDGIKGPLVVDGAEYNGFMPGQAHLDDETIAQILTYMRKSWGNDAEGIEAERVRRIRGETARRADAWTDRELNEMSAGTGQP